MFIFDCPIFCPWVQPGKVLFYTGSNPDFLCFACDVNESSLFRVAGVDGAVLVYVFTCYVLSNGCTRWD